MEALPGRLCADIDIDAAGAGAEGTSRACVLRVDEGPEGDG